MVVFCILLVVRMLNNHSSASIVIALKFSTQDCSSPEKKTCLIAWHSRVNPYFINLGITWLSQSYRCIMYETVHAHRYC